MRSLLALFVYLHEGIKHVSSPTGAHFHDVLLRKIDANDVPRHARAILLGFVLLASLRTKTYRTTLDTAKRHGDEVLWNRLDQSIPRRIFELAIVFGEYSVARSTFGELRDSGKLNASDIETLRMLMSWASGATNRQSLLDPGRKYFVEYPEYDEWLKGRVAQEAGRSAESAVHFRKCLELAPLDATELKDDVRRRLQESQ
jgi:hypothetical protein